MYPLTCDFKCEIQQCKKSKSKSYNLCRYLFVWLAEPGGAGHDQFDSGLTGIVAAQTSGEILLLLKRHAGLLVDRGKGDDVHVGGGPLEDEAGEGAGKGKRRFVTQTNSVYGELEKERYTTLLRS